MSAKLNAYTLSMMGSYLLDTEGMLFFKERSLIISREGWKFDYFDSMKDAENYIIPLRTNVRSYLLKNVNKNYRNSLALLRFSAANAFLKDSFEVFNVYLRYSNQFDLVKNESWFNYARIMRNTISHNLHVIYSKADLKLLPITWDGVTLNAPLNGAPVHSIFLNYYKRSALFDLMVKFIVNH